MKRTFVMLSMLFAVGALAVLGRPVNAQVAPVPALMSFQGRLAKPDGTPVADSTYAVRFSLHDAATGGTEKWNQTLSAVAVRNGTFAVLLSGFPAGTFNSNLFLEIKVGNDAPLSPRQPLASVAYAMKAGSVADASITNASLANGTLTAEKFAPNAFNPLTWLLGGNSGVTNGFLGTTDNNPLALRTNNVERMRLLPNGNVGIGSSAPTSLFQVGQSVGVDFGGLTTLGVTQRSTDTVALSLRQPIGATRNTQIQFVTGAAISYIEQDRFTSNLLFGTNGAGGQAGLTLDTSGNGGFRGGISARSAFLSGSLNARNSLLVGGGASVDTLTVTGEGTAISTVDNAVRTRLFSSNSTNSGYVGTSSPHNLILRTRDLDRMIIDPDGNIAVGGGRGSQFGNVVFTIQGGTHQHGLYVNGPNTTSYALYVNGRAAGTNGFLVDSDARYKKNIATFPDALQTVLNLRGVTYDWRRDEFKEKGFDDKPQVGFIAQEVEKVLPQLVFTSPDGYKSVNYMGVAPVLVEAVKTLKKENDDLRATLAEVLRRLDVLENGSKK